MAVKFTEKKGSKRYIVHIDGIETTKHVTGRELQIIHDHEKELMKFRYAGASQAGSSCL